MTLTDEEHHDLFPYANIYSYFKNQVFFSSGKDWTKALISANSNLLDLLD